MNEPYVFRGLALPDDIRDSLFAYQLHHVPPGGFLMAVLENNLEAAVHKADLRNSQLIPVIVDYIYQRMDRRCWGNPVKVSDWIFEGRQAREDARRAVNHPDY